jgi:hypothetical protein
LTVKSSSRDLTSSFTVPMSPAEAFPLVLGELTDALCRQGMSVELWP